MADNFPQMITDNSAATATTALGLKLILSGRHWPLGAILLTSIAATGLPLMAVWINTMDHINNALSAIGQLGSIIGGAVATYALLKNLKWNQTKEIKIRFKKRR